MKHLPLPLLMTAVILAGQAAFAAPHGVLYTKETRKVLNALTATENSTQSAAPKLLYYGGPVISHVKTYAVFWGNGVDATTVKQIGDFLKATTNSNYMDWLKEYNTNVKAVDGRQGTNQEIGRGTFAGNILITPEHTSKNINDTDIQAELDSQITKGNLPASSDDTIYMIYFPPGIKITIEGMSSCSSFCAYHEGFQSKTHGNVYYGVMPDLGGACSFGCGFASNRFDSLTAISSHELIEAVTDPFPTPGDKPAFPQAWNTFDGNEIGDLCASTSSRLTTQGLTYILQGEFDNLKSGCQTGTYQSP